jgi:hypothetical protein
MTALVLWLARGGPRSRVRGCPFCTTIIRSATLRCTCSAYSTRTVLSAAIGLPTSVCRRKRRERWGLVPRDRLAGAGRKPP